MSNLQISPVLSGTQQFSNTGAVLTGGLIYTYLAGTTSLATTYQDSAGTTPFANPIVLNSAGRVPAIWLVNGIQYKFVVKTATGITLETVDGVQGAGQLLNSPYSPPVTTNGDIFTYNNGPTRLPIGSTGQVLSVVSGEPTWTNPTAGGITQINATPAGTLFGQAINVSVTNPTGPTATIVIGTNQFTSTNPGVVPGSGGDGTKALFGDGVWKTVTSGGTPGGSSGQVQWNNAGAFAGSNLQYSEGTGGLPTLTIHDPTYSGNHFTLGFVGSGGTEAVIANYSTGLIVQGNSTSLEMSGDANVTTPGQFVVHTGSGAVLSGINNYGGYYVNGSIGSAGQVLTSGGAGAPATWGSGGSSGVTSLTAGTGITLSGSTGAVTISATGSGPAVPTLASFTSYDAITSSVLSQGVPGVAIQFPSFGDAHYAAAFTPSFPNTVTHLTAQLTCNIGVTLALSNYNSYGICLKESATGKVYTFTYNQSANAYYNEYFTSPSTRTAYSSLGAFTKMPYFRFVLGGGNIVTQISGSGMDADWFSVNTVTIASAFTTFPDLFGVCGTDQGSAIVVICGFLSQS